MPTRANLCGRKVLYRGKLYSIRSDADIYGSPHKRQQPMEDLPEECLFEIFRRMPSKERCVSACVSKRWLGILSSIRKADICNADLNDAKMDCGEEEEEGSLSRFLLGETATDLRLLAMAVGVASRGGLEKLLVDGIKFTRGVTDVGLSGIARVCPDLKTISLCNVSCVGDKGLSEVAKGCPLLKRVDLSHCPSITNEGLVAIAEKCPNLSVLTLESCARIGSDGLKAIAQRCTKLEMVSIKDCPLIRDQAVGSLSASSLTRLKLNGLKISDFSLAVLGHYGKSIVHLSLSNLENVSEEGFMIMGSAGGLRSLMSLAITSCFGVTDRSIEAIGKGCLALKQICLRKCCFVFDQGLTAFSRSAVSLESLHLIEMNWITLCGVIAALSVCQPKLRIFSLVGCFGIRDMALGENLVPAKPCRSIRSLAVRNCPGFGNAGLTLLGRMCPELHQLDLSGIYGITDEGLLSFVKSREGALVKLNLNGCLNLSDEVITAVVRAHGETLKTMSLEGCRKLSDVSLLAIAKHCQSLGDLYMSHCSITDYGLHALSSAGQLSLEVLSLSDCRWLSDNSVPSLVKMQGSLYGLNLQHCRSISRKSIDLLTEILLGCDLLY